MFFPELTFNDLVAQEIGLEVDPYDRRLIDQDTRSPIMVNSKYLTVKTREEGIHAEEVGFDPLHNTKQMQLLFGYYLKKLNEENGWYTDTIYVKNDVGQGKSSLAIKVNGQELVSRPYVSESVKYADLLCRLNGGTMVDLSQYDIQYT